MTIQFRPNDLESLKSSLSSIFHTTLWQEKSKNAFQAKNDKGASITYYSTTGKIMVQGKDEIAQEYEEKVRAFIFPANEASRDEDSIDSASNKNLNYLSDDFPDNEIVIGLVGAVGVEQKLVIDILTDRLKITYKYNPELIKVSSDVIKSLSEFETEKSFASEAKRIDYYMDLGNGARERSKNNAILAMGASKVIESKRSTLTSIARRAYIIDSLKNPEEVKYLREVYGNGFFLIGVFSDEDDRKKYLMNDRHLSLEEAENLILRDNDEDSGHGQHASDTFILSDFFVYIDENRVKLKHSLNRFLDIIFGHPYVSPTFEEYAMFMSFATSLRSADLSRQVGAVVTRNNEIIASGTNDVPTAGGGLYWPQGNVETDDMDIKDGRDYKRKGDTNAFEKQKIIQNIMGSLGSDIDKESVKKVLEKSQIKDIIEYNRAVHAEMEALLLCARNNISTRGANLYCTTFPCHNCAKHIVAAGIKTVIYIEPYPKSKAIDFHGDSIKLGFAESENENIVNFQPFVGVGPRKFFDLFSMSFGSGRVTKRKDSNGSVLTFTRDSLKVKLPLIPINYLEREKIAIRQFNELTESR
jgi:deoxycytidylate deaminase